MTRPKVILRHGDTAISIEGKFFGVLWNDAWLLHHDIDNQGRVGSYVVNALSDIAFRKNAIELSGDLHRFFMTMPADGAVVVNDDGEPWRAPVLFEEIDNET
jgi:hypothetical protein